MGQSIYMLLRSLGHQGLRSTGASSTGKLPHSKPFVLNPHP